MSALGVCGFPECNAVAFAGQYAPHHLPIIAIWCRNHAERGHRFLQYVAAFFYQPDKFTWEATA